MTQCKAYGAAEAHAPLVPMDIDRRAPRDDDVAIRIAYCGVCHTDLHIAHNDWGTTVYPMVPGHEIVGHVTAVGAKVTGFKPGDRVAVGALVDSCQNCAACADHDEPYCAKGPTTTYNGIDVLTGERTMGGYATDIVVRDCFVIRVPEGLDLSRTGPLLCAGITVWTPLRQKGVGKGSKVGVVGLGGIGHMAVKLAVALGAEVTVITSSPGKMDDALALGAHDVLLSSDKAAMAAKFNSFDLIIDTIPSRHDVNSYLMLLGRGGMLAPVGALDLLEPIHGALLARNHRSITGSLMGGISETQALLDFCAEHQVLPDCEMIAMADINSAFARMQTNDVKYRFVIEMASLA
ncbi:NAD(P)-dependent alcohol dehydrogenase [Novosphingobium aquae]|uniref:NAD(P)-dependent alcohol dehydrogenase n=1 Tax=Novosphingobium aquae TaxID=3133435 RepID=A0ABU8S6E3_9SPHN